MNGVNEQIVDEPMEIGKLNGRILDVGGAEGIDAIAESLGKQHDMQVHVIVNPQHERAQFVTSLSPNQLQEGLHHVYKANETLCRNTDTNVSSSGYLQRNYWIVKDAQTIIAFGAFENRGFHKTVLQGGTGWSVQMALDAQTTTVYVHVTSTTIVGSRQPTEDMIQELEDLFQKITLYCLKMRA